MAGSERLTAAMYRVSVDRLVGNCVLLETPPKEVTEWSGDGTFNHLCLLTLEKFGGHLREALS